MAHLIETPTLVPGVEPKTIEEFVGLAATGSTDVSVARMVAPAGWSEPGQVPEFSEVTLVLEGTVVVETAEQTHVVSAGQAIRTDAGAWVRYSTPPTSGATYVAVCVPAFSIDTVHRD